MTIASAHVEMQGMMLRSRERAARRRHVDALVRCVDHLIEEVEELNLRRRKSVPRTWSGRIRELAPMLPFPIDPRWLGARSTTEALDMLFEIQSGLLRLRSGPLAPDLLEVDAQIEAHPVRARPARARARGSPCPDSAVGSYRASRPKAEPIDRFGECALGRTDQLDRR